MKGGSMIISLFRLAFLLCLLAAPLSAAAAPKGAVALVNDMPVYGRELEAEMNRLIPRMTIHGAVSEERRREFREKALQNLIERTLQYQDALRMGLRPDKKQVRERMKQVRGRFSSRKDYRQALEQAGISEEELRAGFEKELLALAAVEKAVTRPSQMGEQELRDYFEQHRSRFRQPESVRIRIISMKDEGKAREALGKARAGEDFGSLASRYSEDMYRIKGGDLGYVHKGRIFPELEKAAFAMQPGETSGLIRAEASWFIIRLEDRRPEQELTFAEAREKLEKDLEAKRAAEIRESWMAGLRSSAVIEIVSGNEAGSKDGHWK